MAATQQGEHEQGDTGTAGAGERGCGAPETDREQDEREQRRAGSGAILGREPVLEHDEEEGGGERHETQEKDTRSACAVVDHARGCADGNGGASA